MTETKIIKLSANENCYGCSPKALLAIEKNYKNVHLYPDLVPLELKKQLALKFCVNPENVVIGAGSVKIIDGIIQTFVKQGEEVLTFEKSFVAYGQLSELYGHKCRFAPLTDWRCEPANLLPFINNNTRVIFLANPNNPTGTIIKHNDLKFLLDNIPENILVALDEAYAEYVFDSEFPSAINLQKTYKNLIVLRSFSKIYGLAGLRIGYAILNETYAEKLSKTQIPYSLNYLAANTALAALNDESFVKNSAKLNHEESKKLVKALKESGYNTIESQSNFIYLWFDTDEKKDIVYNLLLKNGIAICDLKVFGQSQSLRIGVGTSEVNNSIISILSVI